MWGVGALKASAHQLLYCLAKSVGLTEEGSHAVTPALSNGVTSRKTINIRRDDKQ